MPESIQFYTENLSLDFPFFDFILFCFRSGVGRLFDLLGLQIFGRSVIAIAQIHLFKIVCCAECACARMHIRRMCTDDEQCENGEWLRNPEEAE